MPITRPYISPIKSVQRGEATIPISATSIVATASAVNMAKSRLTLLGTRGTDTTMTAINSLGTIALTSPTQITLSRVGSSSTHTLSMSWELTEYN